MIHIRPHYTNHLPQCHAAVLRMLPSSSVALFMSNHKQAITLPLPDINARTKLNITDAQATKYPQLCRPHYPCQLCKKQPKPTTASTPLRYLYQQYILNQNIYYILQCHSNSTACQVNCNHPTNCTVCMHRRRSHNH